MDASEFHEAVRAKEQLEHELREIEKQIFSLETRICSRVFK
jgi:hypothetical protein